MVSSDRVVAFATFNGSSSDKMSWMSEDRLIESSWEDLSDYMAEEPVVVSLQGRYCWQRQSFSWWRHHFPRYWPFCAGSSSVNSPRKDQGDAELWRFFLSVVEQIVEQTIETRWFEKPSRSLWRHCNVHTLFSSFNASGVTMTKLG